MVFLLKIFVSFWLLWFIWYFTGGPLRDDKNKMFIGPNNEGKLEFRGRQ